MFFGLLRVFCSAAFQATLLCRYLMKCFLCVCSSFFRASVIASLLPVAICLGILIFQNRCLHGPALRPEPGRRLYGSAALRAQTSLCASTDCRDSGVNRIATCQRPSVQETSQPIPTPSFYRGLDTRHEPPSDLRQRRRIVKAAQGTPPTPSQTSPPSQASPSNRTGSLPHSPHTTHSTSSPQHPYSAAPDW